VIVAFYRIDRNGRQSVGWEALRGKRTRVPGTVMAVGVDLPHDLAQYVIEASTGYDMGFWGLVAKGATFKSTGRKLTKPGRAVIAQHRDELVGSETLAARHLALWKTGASSPTSDHLSHALAQWRLLRVGERLTFEWPSPLGVVREVTAGAMAR
jgi:hypothetical protein